MKKNLEKKLVLKKETVAKLNAEQLEALYGGATYKCWWSEFETVCGSCEVCR